MKWVIKITITSENPANFTAEDPANYSILYYSIDIDGYCYQKQKKNAIVYNTPEEAADDLANMIHADKNDDYSKIQRYEVIWGENLIFPETMEVVPC